MSNSFPNDTVNPEAVIYKRNQHSISRSSIDPDALKIMYRLLRNGHKAYLVGGSVRDLILGNKPKDFDIATDATPKKIKTLFRNSRIIGKRFKLVHVYFGNGKILEVSTFRDFSAAIETEASEIDSFEHLSRKDFSQAVKPLSLPDNTYGTEASDALRRDLTINGLFYDPATFSIIDYVGGMRDLNEQIIRVIGNPLERFAEDPVRMLRTVRHAAKNNFTIEQKALEAIAVKRHLISESPPMRIFEEIKKDLICGHCLGILRLLASCELLEFILPELLQNTPALFDDNSRISKLVKAVDDLANEGKSLSPSVVLAALVLAEHQDVDIADEIENKNELEKLKQSAKAFLDQEYLRAYLNSTFSVLAVPRKEKERIEEILSIWAYLNANDQEELRSSKLRCHSLEKEVKDFLIITNTDSRLLEILAKALLSSKSRRSKRPHNQQRDFAPRRYSNRRWRR